ncbi:phosphonate ABC transporter, permease protein PhnE [Sneathiella chinensis]|uniref:Phosphonate ABC transporter, permease protein PhnE n=1 Tax=Sneathiella chinensis TaxID=349750 RepID=A0ABQ5U3T7_9PROT|nr:phosphonate ABC transporter, permease protein PhnE [Sneathiella chinensis]GLQ06488.1 phosphonate ABC transporter, permease protein PhnE [Sneathiella chinensis]
MTSSDTTTAVQRRYKPKRNWLATISYILLGVYLVYVLSLFDVNTGRLADGMEHGANFLGRMFPPNFERYNLLIEGLLESMQIAIIATTAGVVLSLPVGFLAARNLMPAWVTWPARLLIVACRSFHPVIVAILFVKAVGFGALAGTLALVVASIGFIAKLFAEAIEEISLKQIEAIRATGAPFGSVIIFGVLPQVMGRFIGFTSYQLDSNLRNSTMVGIVGAGGIGGTLFAAFQRFDYDFVSAILISIIALIMAAEGINNIMRRLYR